MTKISELGNISGASTKSRDLFVTVNLDQGEDGTKNITREQLAAAIQQEVFDDIKVSGGYVDNVSADNVDISNSTITDVNIVDPYITVTEQFNSDISDEDYFYLNDTTLGETVAISYSQFYNEIAETAKKSNKVYVGNEGNDTYAGSYLKPVASLEKAVELAWVASAAGIPTAISVLPGDYYTNGNLALPDLCTVVSTNGQYATKIIMNDGYEEENCILLGSGCYVQGFSFFNLRVDNFDYPSKGFAFAFRPGARIVRSPYVRDSSQISNYFNREIAPLLNPLNSRGTIEDLGYEITVSDVVGTFEVDDTIETDGGATGFISRVSEIGTGTIYIRNTIGDLQSNTVITSSSGGTATIVEVGEEDYPNKSVGRGGGMIIADRKVLDPDSIFTYLLCFGATPRTQNGLGYVAKNGAGINGISSLSIFARCSFYALNGGQISLNNSGTQFGDISIRAKGSTPVFNPRETGSNNIIQSTELASELLASANNIIDDLWIYLANTEGFSTYDSEKCARDISYILNGVSNDITLGTNYWSIVNGIAYTRAASSVVIGDQLVETSGAITHLKSLVADTLSDTNSIARSNASFDEVIDILENGTSAANTIFLSSTGNTNYDNAAEIVAENKNLIINDLINWIDANYPTLDYNENTCARDTGYIIDAITHDLNYNTNIATILNAEAYFVGAVSQLPLDQREPTASAIAQLGTICSQVVLGTYTGQSATGDIATSAESNRCLELTGIITDVILENSLSALPVAVETDLSWVDTNFRNSKEVIEEKLVDLQELTIAFVNKTYNFIDETLTRRDALNLITSLSNDFKEGTQTATRIFVTGLFNYEGRHVFSVFNPSTIGLKYIGSVASILNLPLGSTVNINDAYIVYADPANIYDGVVYYWDGTDWVEEGNNDVSLLAAFTNSWDRMRTYIVDNLSLSANEETMIDGLVDDVLIASANNPRILQFGSLVESLSHQFNLASAGVNVNALPLNFRRLGRPISAAASVLQEDGGRVRWSGADELNNQYFAKGLKINGRTGRLEGRPFTSSVRKLARRASNSRASI